jgi:hypothetical protein
LITAYPTFNKIDKLNAARQRTLATEGNTPPLNSKIKEWNRRKYGSAARMVPERVFN